MFKMISSIMIILVMTFNASFATAFEFDGIQDEVYLNLTNYNTEFTINYYGDTEELPDKISQLLNDASHFDDYINYVINGWKIKYDYSTTESTLNVTFDYKTTKDNELFVRSEVTAILKSLNLTGLSDYKRLEKIIMYMNQNYSYDKTLKKHTAYDLITTKEAVCQGYAEMLYLLAKGAHIPVRNQAGTLKETPHLWNLVKIGNYWYHLDITNYHLFDSEPYIVVSNSSLYAEQYGWTNLVESTSDAIGQVDIQFNSIQYSDDMISNNLSYRKSNYSLSATANDEKNKFETAAALSNQLKLDLKDIQAIQSISQYNNIVNNLNKLKESGYKLEEVSGYIDQVHLLSEVNIKNMGDLYKSLIETSNSSLIKPMTESSLIKAIKVLEEGQFKINEKTFDNSQRAFLYDSLSVKIKSKASELIKLYKQLYAKTKKSTYKDKYIALAKKYKIAY